MTFDELEHAIRAACKIANDNEVWVFGSQAVLGSFRDPPPSLTASIEVDVEPIYRPDHVDLIDGALGEGSMFHTTHGFYVHGVRMDGLVKLPLGWRERTVEIHHPVGTHNRIGRCLEPHDLAVSKLAAFREKDKAFVRTLLIERMIDRDVLLNRVESTDLDTELLQRLTQWIQITTRGLDD